MLVSRVLLSFISFTAATIVNASPVEKRQQAYPEGVNGIVVNNNLGQAHGVLVEGGAVARFVVKYATAARFGNPLKSSGWVGIADYGGDPPACPQSIVDPSKYSEDCLYAVMYVPVTATVTPRVTTIPVYTWFHGGSFMTGSASNAGLDGSKLALATNSIVIVVQYRLGILGWLPPSGGPVPSGNLGVKDATVALDFIKGMVWYFGGNPNKITIGGQSSGGHMVRALLASPAAASFFTSGTIHADPIGYGFMTTTIYNKLRTAFYAASATCTGGNAACLQSASVSSLLSAQNSFFLSPAFMGVDPAVGLGEPLRPNFDGSVITTTLTTSYPANKKPLLLTSNKDDAGTSIGNNFPAGLPSFAFSPIVAGSIGAAREATITSSPFYLPGNANLPVAYVANGDETRQSLSRMGTDQLWRCPAADLAKRWTAQGGKAWVGVFQVGASHADNQYADICHSNGFVCHEDEIYLIFGTTASPTPAQAAVTTAWQARLKSFLIAPSSGPVATGQPAWAAATSSDPKVIQLGGGQDGQLAPVLACDPAFWGAAVPFDWQVFGE